MKITLRFFLFATALAIGIFDQAKAGIEENKTLVRGFYRDVFQAHNADAAGKYLDPSYIQHNPDIPSGLTGFQDYFRKLWAIPAPSEKVEILHLIAEGDLVVAQVEWGDKSIGFDLYRVRNGKLAEHWDPVEPPNSD